MEVILKHLILLLIIISLIACHDTSKTDLKNPSPDSQPSNIKLDSSYISEFKWNISNTEKGEPYFEGLSFIKFSYQGKEYIIDTLYSHVSPCDFLEPAIGEPCSSLKKLGVLGAYYGADAGLFYYGQIMNKGDSLEYRHWCESEEEDGLSEEIITTYSKQSTNKSEKKETDNYVGNYISKDDACDIKLSIQKSGLQYKYELNTSNLKNLGILKIVKESNDVYFEFLNLNSDSEGYPIQASVNDEELIIQNYGNAINQYHHIKDCDIKYILLTKEKN